MSVRIILADDHDAVRQAMRRILETEPDFEIEGEARNGKEVIQLVKQSLPDVVLMDVTMPIVNGIEATRKLHQSYPDVKVIGYSSHATEAIVLGMFRAGASGYVLKPSSEAELKQAIGVVIKGQAYASPSIYSILLDKIRGMDEKNNKPHKGA